jgi:hypothetical protein
LIPVIRADAVQSIELLKVCVITGTGGSMGRATAQADPVERNQLWLAD